MDKRYHWRCDQHRTGYVAFAYHMCPEFALAYDEEIPNIQTELGPGGGFEEMSKSPPGD
jgi:hypothetical protein